MRRPTCTGPRPEVTVGDSGRWLCDGLVRPSIAARLARLLARARSLDHLHRVLITVEQAGILCKLDADQVAALRSMHGRAWRALASRESNPLLRSARMLARS